LRQSIAEQVQVFR